MTPMIMELEIAELKESIKVNVLGKLLNINAITVGLIAFTLYFGYYLGLVQVWRLTSPNYPPANVVDQVVRAPEQDDLTINRREHGICPVEFGGGNPDLSKILDLNCFIE